MTKNELREDSATLHKPRDALLFIIIIIIIML